MASRARHRRPRPAAVGFTPLPLLAGLLLAAAAITTAVGSGGDSTSARSAATCSAARRSPGPE